MLTQSFGQLVPRHLDDSAIVLGTPLPIPKSIGLSILSLRTENPMLVLAVLVLWVVFTLRLGVWRQVCISKPLLAF